MKKKITMIGAGSPGFSMAVGKELMQSPILAESVLMLMDIDAARLEASQKRLQQKADELGSGLEIQAITNRRKALENADYVVTSCEPHRVPFWIQDLEIAQSHGVEQLTGENGGPGGQIHAMRNITMFMSICGDMQDVCPDAWLMNFTNPMSFLCTYFHRHGNVKALGFCHQVHGSFGVIGEMLGMAADELDVITAGVNHFNWLIDIRKKGTAVSFLDEFLELVKNSDYWRDIRPDIPPQRFTREILEVFGAYPVGYDDHIAEYTPFFYNAQERQEVGYQDHGTHLKQWLDHVKTLGDNVFEAQVKAVSESEVPFPKDPDHPTYKEKTCLMMEALATNTPTYTDAINIVNHGSIDNLPADAVVDIPAVAVGGEVRGLHVGSLPRACAELCRRQITIHELVVDATVHGDRQAALQAMCLDPYIHGLAQAKKLLENYLETYREYLPQFQ